MSVEIYNTHRSYLWCEAVLVAYSAIVTTVIVVMLTRSRCKRAPKQVVSSLETQLKVAAGKDDPELLEKVWTSEANVELLFRASIFAKNVNIARFLREKKGAKLVADSGRSLIDLGTLCFLGLPEPIRWYAEERLAKNPDDTLGPSWDNMAALLSSGNVEAYKFLEPFYKKGLSKHLPAEVQIGITIAQQGLSPFGRCILEAGFLFPEVHEILVTYQAHAQSYIRDKDHSAERIRDINQKLGRWLNQPGLLPKHLGETTFNPEFIAYVYRYFKL